MTTEKSSTENKYKKHTLLSHILEIPDTYIGSIENTNIETFIYEDDKMIKKQIKYNPGLYKIYDEIIVNAIDHYMRLTMEKDKENIKYLKNIKVNIDKETGWIIVFNDGNGIDIEKHSQYDNIWIPELIFGELLTSANYNKEEEKMVGGKNGFGAKLANIFSKEFIIETVDHKRKKIFTQKFKNNMTERETPIIKSCSKLPYTKISFLPDYKRFNLEKLTDDMYKLFHKRVFDACANTGKEVNVYFNDEKILIKDFEKYVNLFLDTKDIQERYYECCGENWEIVVAESKSGTFEQISFVNGINTLKGGKHVEYITNNIIKKITELVLQKKKKTLKTQHLKDNIFLFIRCLVVNPSFDSQTKETLTTPISKFGTKCEISDKFYEKIYKSSIITKSLLLTDFTEEKKLVKTDGKKISRVIVPKLDDANLAGTKHSTECTLILTEGDSAKTMAISGLSVVGRDKYGVFPLKGKILNVKDASIQKISENAEIANLKKILGLEQCKNYKDLSSLRYGKIMIMTDQDHDGSHIKGLLFNVFQSLWNSLYQIEGFLTSMLTPIIKATNSKTKKVIEFYSMTDFENWQEKNKENWKIKYYKGLGTSTDNEAKEYFKQMKLITYKYTEKSDENLDLAFNKKRANDRKEWLMNYDKNDILNYTDTTINYEDFINKDLIHFSNRDLERSIPCICDGLKESTRKILFACMKKKLYNNEIKVAQLAGYVSETTAYHHGENSLQQAIIGMAQIFVGTNNINILVPIGQFGSRVVNSGGDSASPRYIFTLLSKLTKLIFKEEDNIILDNIIEDGEIIEPLFYIPIIPMILVNGALGIGTGFSTNIPQYNPEEIINICIKICDEISNNDKKTYKEVIEELELKELIPWYLGFKGSITKTETSTSSINSYTSKGVYKITDNVLEITELPIGTWTEDYKEFLEKMIIEDKIKSFTNHYTAKNIKFVIILKDGYKIENIEADFKLTSTKNLSISNMHLYSSKCSIKKYNDTSSIIKEWSIIRLDKYNERKEYQLKKLRYDYDVMNSKIRFITDVIDGNIIIMNKKMSDIIKRLEELEYKSYKEEENEEDVKDKYKYLLKMQISQLTYEKKEELEKETDVLKNKIENLEKTPIELLWKTELEELMKEWINHKNKVEQDYLDDLKNISKSSSVGSKKKK